MTSDELRAAAGLVLAGRPLCRCGKPGCRFGAAETVARAVLADHPEASPRRPFVPGDLLGPGGGWARLERIADGNTWDSTIITAEQAAAMLADRPAA